MEPAPEEGVDGARAKAVADALQRGWIGTPAEAIVEFLVGDASLVQLALGPTMPVEPEPDRIRRVGVGLPEGRAPLRIPQIEIEMVDEPHLAAPLHVGMLGLLLSLPFPRAPGRGFLLSNPNQDHRAIAALFGRGAQQRLSDLLLVFFLGEVANGNTVGFGPAVDLGHIGFADLAERRRGGNRKATLPMEKPAHLADGLQLGHVRLQEDAIDLATGQRDVVTQQRGIIGHGVVLFGLERWKATSTKGTSAEVPFVQSWSATLRLFGPSSAARRAHHAG